MTPAAFELGINYWPRRSAMYMWRELDLAEVRDDMAHIAAMGFHTVRVFALTEDFLPAPARVDARMVDRLVQVASAAADAGLRIVPTLVVINMSGRMWWPGWMLDSAGQPMNLYEGAALDAQALLVRTCAGALADHPALRALDLTNEIDDAQRPPSRDAGRRWCTVLATAVRRAAPRVPIQIGAHLPSLTAGNSLRVDDIGAAADEDVMHAYPLYHDGARSFLDPELVPFSCALTADLAGRQRAPLMQEFGLCTAPRGMRGHSITDEFLGAPRAQYLASEDEGAGYYRNVLERLIAAGAAGAYAWCYGDYHPRLFDRPPLDRAVRERSFGLVRADGTEKPAVAVFRDVARRLTARPQTTGAPRVLDVSADEYYRAPRAHFDRLYARWLRERTA